MRKFRFTSGDIINYPVLTESPNDVFEKVVNAFPNANLGILYIIHEDGTSEDEDLFGSTITALKNLGRWNENTIDNDLKYGILEEEYIS